MLEQLQQVYYSAFNNVIFVEIVNKAVIKLGGQGHENTKMQTLH